MSNQIVKALEHAAEKIGKTLAKDAGKAVKELYHSAGENLKKVAKNVREVEEKHAKDLAKLFEKGGKGEGHHPHVPGGGPKGHGHGHPKGSGRGQVKDPRTEGRDHGSRKCPGEPVDIATGRMFIDQVDVSLPGSLPLEFTRNFESGLLTGRWMGPKWLCTFDERLELDDQGVVHIRADRITQAYPHPEPGDPVHASAGSRHELDLKDGLFTITDPATGLVKTFASAPDGDEALLTRVQDRQGRHYTLAYDEDGTPQSITHSGGYRLLVTVDAGRITALRLANATGTGGDVLLLRYSYTDGHLSAVYNSSGKPMRFANDTGGRILSWTDRNNSQYFYTYDQFDRITDEGGVDHALGFRFGYGEPDPVTGLRTHTETNALGNTTTYLINEHAQVAAVTDPLGHTTSYERDEYDRLLAETDPLGRTTRYEYDGAGDLISVTRPDGECERTQYADHLSLPAVITWAGGATWRLTYDQAGCPIALTDPLGATTRYTYDVLGHVASVIDALGRTTLFSCDARGLVTETTDPDGAVTRYQHDAFGRVVAVTDPLGSTTRMSWTVEGCLSTRSTPDGATETWTYDGEGNNLSHVDQLGRTTTYEYTHFDSLSARTTPDGARISFSYDADHQLVAVTGPLGRQWHYRYDGAGRLSGETDFHGRAVEYESDPAGQVVAIINPLGQRTRYSYDPLGRTAAHEVDGRVTSYAYDPAGWLIRASNADAEVLRSVDALGNVLSETVNGRTMTYTHDDLGRRTGRRTPAGHTSTWSYDAADRPTALATQGGTLEFAHDLAGRELRRTIGDRHSLDSTWDSLHRLTGQTLRGATEVLQQRLYSYVADGNLTAVEDRTAGRRTFELDGADRVVAVRAADWTESYAYDLAGNLTTADWPATGATRAALGARDYTGSQLTNAGRIRYEFDGAGRMTLRQVARLSRKPDTWRYSWDAEDRLVEVTTPDGTRWRYRYDPFGRRIAKQRLDGDAVVEETEFTWDGPALAEQTTRAPYLPGPHTVSWDYLGLQPLAQTESVTTQEQVDRRFFAIITDLVGTPTELVDVDGGAVAWHAATTLWGHTSWPTDSTAYTPLRFPGQYFDPETRLHYNLHRYYDPEIARYTSPDPLGLDPGPNPDAYVHNPHIWCDPYGLSPSHSRNSKKGRGGGPSGGPAGGGGGKPGANGGKRGKIGRQLNPGQADDLGNWMGYTRTGQPSAGGSPILKAPKGGKGPNFIAEDMTGHLGGIFKGGKKASDLMSTGKVLRSGTYGIGPIGNGEFGLVWIGE